MRIAWFILALPGCLCAQKLWIAPTEVTQREYAAIIGGNPSHFRGDDLPVENVSWWDAIRYCNLRSVKEALKPCYDLRTGKVTPGCPGYRLPTEAEWVAALGKPQKEANLGGRDTKDAAALVAQAKKGTTKAGSYPANDSGLYDMIGNVWEWCQDWFNAVADPKEKAPGLERTIRGGSFATSNSSWSKGYRSSMNPSLKSRYTGFRVCRREPFSYAPYNVQPAGFETATGKLAPLPPIAGLRERWRSLLGSPSGKPPVPRFRVAETYTEPSYKGSVGYLNLESDFEEKVLILEPPHAAGQRLPVVIVPFYDVDTPAGRNLGGRSFVPMGVRSFAQVAVEQGYIAVAIRWFGESYGEGYNEAVANLAMKHPNSTGLGKWVWDSARLLDYLYTRPDVDRDRIAMIGHSLGGKMTLYATAMDERIKVAVSSEPGIGFSHSNYDDYWYLGQKLAAAPAGMDQHELLALTAPRPFLLIGGDASDKDASWHYINAARSVYGQFGDPLRLGYLNHHSGHSPTVEAVDRAMEWIGHFFAVAGN